MIEKTKEGLKILKGLNNYQALFIDSARIDDCISYLFKNNLRYIEVNSFQGYRLRDLNFLTRLENHLEGIVIPEEHYDYTLINRLHKLKSLGMVDNGKDTIDLSHFPDLESLSCDYSVRLKGLKCCKGLKDLTLTSYKSKSKDLTDLPWLENLSVLSLLKTGITTLRGIERFEHLKELKLFSAPKLETIASMKALSNTLEYIEIDKCKKVSDYQILGEVKALRKIILSESGEIETLAFIKLLPSLEFISFWGTNVLDGDISYCEGISYVGFDNKRHYTHKAEQFERR